MFLYGCGKRFRSDCSELQSIRVQEVLADRIAKKRSTFELRREVLNPSRALGLKLPGFLESARSNPTFPI